MERLKTEMTHWRLDQKKRVVNLGVGVSAVLLYEVARAYYRPFIYEHAINDWYLADTLGNSLGTVATVFVLVALLGRGGRHDYFLIRTVTLSVLVYAVAHPLLGKPIDFLDIVATVLAGVLCEVIYPILHGRPPSTVSKSDTAS